VLSFPRAMDSDRVSGPRKRILTKKAKEVALAQTSKRVRPAAPAAQPAPVPASHPTAHTGSLQLF
jgi:hypothetical protein